MTAHAPALPLRTERLALRPWAPDDVDDLLAYYGDPDVARHLLHGALDRAQVQERVTASAERLDPRRSGEALDLVVELDGRVVGDVMLRLDDGDPPSVAEVGWAMNPAYGGHGLATEACSALVGLGFAHFGLHRVMARMDARNLASARLCERLGMRREAHLRQDWWSKGEWTDTLVYGLLRDEWS